MNQNNLKKLTSPMSFFKSSPDQKIEILSEMVFSLLIEVEVLRELAIENSKYAPLYKEIAITSHNSSPLCQDRCRLQ